MIIGRATGGVSAVGKPGTANQFQGRELVAVPVLRRTHESGIFERASGTARTGRPGVRHHHRLRSTSSTPPMMVRPGIATPGIDWYEVLVTLPTSRNGCSFLRGSAAYTSQSAYRSEEHTSA